MLRLCFIGILTLLTFPALAQDASGTWNAKVDTPNGPAPMVFKFDVSGNKLTGTISTEFFSNLPIDEGTVNGTELSFKLRLQTMTLGYKAVLSGDQLTISSKVVEGRPPGGPEEQTFVAMRAKQL